MWVIIVPLFLILEATLTFPSNVSRSNERYLFASSPDQCDNLGSACATLSSFAANTSDYLQLLVNSNAAELIFHPGNHTLHSRFAIAHINQLWVNSNTSHSSLDTNIVCVNHSARFEFTNIPQIHFSNIKFLGCGGNRAESVVNFSLINTIFDGQQKEDIGRALELVNSSLLAERSSFVSNIDGGAVVVNGSNATFLNCNFEGNHADYGGAIYGNLLSNISIINSTLYDNSATEYGGAISIGALTNGMGNSETLSGISLVLASNFPHNRAEKRGGGMAIVHGSVSIFKSKFTNNIAILTGGALFSGDTSIININRFDFSSNNTTKDGGVVHVFNSTLFITNGTFSLNSAVKGHGGALCLQEGTYELSDCSFMFNEAETFGGAIYTRNS
jgi:predicted outer membrane repeat protein